MVGAGRAASCIIAEHEVTVGAAQPRASSLSCPWILQRQLAALAPLIRPPGTFSRKREKGFFVTSCCAAWTALTAQREKGFCCHVLPRSLPGQPTPRGSGLSREPLVHRAPGHSSRLPPLLRSEEHTSALQSLMRISYAVFC